MSLTLEDISFSYGTQDESTAASVLFEHLDLGIADGEKVLVLGQSGQGKSTLCSIVSLLAPQYTSGRLSGRILHDGVEHGDAHDILDFFSLVPQNPSDWFLTGTAEDEVALPLEALGTGHEQMASRVWRELEAWGLERYHDTPLGELSGGERKRVALACALVTRPRLCVYDESFDDLDARWKARLSEVIATGPGSALVTSCRFLDEFDGLFDSIWRISDGRLERIGQDEARKADAFTFTPPRPMRTGCFEVHGLSFHRPGFDLSVPSFHVAAGEVVCLTGPNGSGKSTFARLVCALEQKASGDITIDGVRQSDGDLMRRVGYVFQNPDHQIFLPTVRDELMSCLDHLAIGRGEKREKVDRTAELFALDPDENACLMSYGRRKRLQCAIYHLLERPYYILDEIEAALPASDGAHMVELLSSRGAGIIVISHDRAFARRIASRSYTIEEGVMHEVQ